MMHLKDPKAIRDWVRYAITGDRAVYHVGMLCRDADVETAALISANTEARARSVASMGRAAMAACERGMALLTQKRHGPAHYEYRMTRSSLRVPEGADEKAARNAEIVALFQDGASKRDLMARFAVSARQMDRITSAAKVEKMAEMHLSGMSWPEIARAFGFKTSDNARRLVEQHTEQSRW